NSEIAIQRNRAAHRLLLQPRHQKTQLLRGPVYTGRAPQSCLATIGREGRLQYGGSAEDLGCLLRFLQGSAKKAARAGRAQGLWHRVSIEYDWQRLQPAVRLFPDRLWRPGHRRQRWQIAPR